MTGDLEKMKQFSEMRNRAEDLLRQQMASAQTTGSPLSAAGTIRALHELSVHQIELEMQNEELQRVLGEAEAARACTARLERQVRDLTAELEVVRRELAAVRQRG